MPTDRTKMKAKYHPTVRADGTPLACREAAADVNGTPAFERLFLAAPACVCTVFADKGYDAESNRTLCRTSHAALCIHKRGQPHASGPGEYRWPVERTLSWLLENKRRGCATIAAVSSSDPYRRRDVYFWWQSNALGDSENRVLAKCFGRL
jgi:hypothetical protein